MRNIPVGGSSNDWPWKTPQTSTGANAVSQITGFVAGDCYQIPAACFDFDEFRIVLGATQGDTRTISFNLAG